MTARDNTKNFWDKWHDNPMSSDSLSGFCQSRVSGEIARRTLSAIFRHYDFSQLRQSVVMDFGCGTGRLSKMLAEHCKTIVAADISPKFLSAAENNLGKKKNVSFLLLEPNSKLPFKKDSIDFSFCYAVLIASSKENFLFTLSELDRVCKSFCIQVSSANENYNPAQTDQYADLAFSDAKGYRPTPDTLRGLFEGPNYILEELSPDTRGKELFFYKINLDNNALYQRIGRHVLAEEYFDPAPANFLGALSLSSHLLKRAIKRRVSVLFRSTQSKKSGED